MNLLFLKVKVLKILVKNNQKKLIKKRKLLKKEIKLIKKENQERAIVFLKN